LGIGGQAASGSCSTKPQHMKTPQSGKLAAQVSNSARAERHGTPRGSGHFFDNQISAPRAAIPGLTSEAGIAAPFTLGLMLNHGYAYASTITHKDAGERLLSHLARAYPHSSLAEWQQNLTRGEVTLEGVLATGEEPLRAGQKLIWNRPPWQEPEAPLHYEILYEDAAVLAVNKPSGLPTLPGAGFHEHTLLHLVQRDFAEANPVHRLGRGTSGIVLFARTSEAAARLTALWNTEKVQKIYSALAQGVAAQNEYVIETPIGQVPHPRIGKVWAATPNGKPSKSVARVIERSAETTTFAVTLHSGRPHQIRIHLASIGHPLVGDPLYRIGGLPLAELPGLPGDLGYLLHAGELRFEHPVSGVVVVVNSPQTI